MTQVKISQPAIQIPLCAIASNLCFDNKPQSCDYNQNNVVKQFYKPALTAISAFMHKWMTQSEKF